MTEHVTFDEFDREVTAFQLRLQELRAIRTLDIGGEEATEAAFLELETAAEELRVAHEQLWATSNMLAQANAPEDRDRHLLRVVFRELPLPVILIDREGRIRRVNQRAAELLGAGADYLSGKPFPVFVDLPQRAALRSHLAAFARRRPEETTTLSTSLLRQGRPMPVRLVLSTVQVPTDRRPVIVVVVVPATLPPPAQTPPGTSAPAAAAQLPSGDDDTISRPALDDDVGPVRATVRRLDLTTSAARLLLAESGSSPAAIAQSLGRLLCEQFAEWVIVDLVRGGELTRAAVCGPGESTLVAVAGALERAPVGAPGLPCSVIEGGHPWLEAHVEDPSILGEDERGVPFVSATGAHSVLSVAIEDRQQSQGAITALRGRNREPFTLSEQAALHDVAGVLGLALRTEDRVERRTTAVRLPPAALAPRTLPSTPGLQVAWFQRSARYDGDAAPGLLDVYPSLSGLGAVIGDTEIGGEQAALTLSMVRHWARLLGLTGKAPEALLPQLDTALRDSGDSAQVVAVSAVQVTPAAAQAAVRLASAGQRSSLVLRADGRVQQADGGGSPLGKRQDLDVHVADSQLEPGDLLVCYNNALFDVRNIDGDSFGRSGQLGIALARSNRGTAQDAMNSLSEAVATFTGGVPGPDLVALGVKFTGAT